MRNFNSLFVAGVAVILLLAGLGLYPMALVMAAALVPLLTSLYVYDVDVYEDEPLRVIGLTMLGGLIAGLITGVVARVLAPADATSLSFSTAKVVGIRGVFIPLLGLVLSLIGPVILLNYERFNDALDGVTFGVSSASMFAGTALLVQVSSLFQAGFRPGGAQGPWIVRLLGLGVALPLLFTGVGGAVCAALWLRFRAPLRDRGALGLLGNPPVAFLAGAALLVAGSVVQSVVSGGIALAALLVLDIVVLLWLRYAIHIGLLEEAREIDIGPEITCPNCRRPTPNHSFCINCGVSFQALPKAPSAAAVPGGGER
jgi:hypothetical protein